MRRLISLCTAVTLVSAVLLFSIGCTKAADGNFKDDSGAYTELPERPLRVAVLFSSLAELWCLAGGELHATVGETVERGIADEGVLLVDGGAGKTIDLEALIASDCELVIGSADVPAQVRACETMRSLGVPSILLHLESFSDYLRILKLFCTLTGSDAYERYGTPLEGEIEQILSSAREKEPKKILFLRAGASASSLRAKGSQDHFAAAMLAELGCINLADKAPILVDGLSIELILAEDPDLILVSTMGDEEAAIENVRRCFRDAAWQSLSAVQNGRVYFLDKAHFQYKPNARWATAYLILSELIYGTNEEE